MGKEVFIAILVGATFGILIAFGIWRANIALSPSSTKDRELPGGTQQERDKDQQKEPGNLTLGITSPENESVVSESTVNIAGITKPNVYVVVVGEEDEVLTLSDERGNWQLDIELIGGLNDIKIISFDSDGSSIEKILTLVYSTEIATKAGSQTSPSATVTESVSDKIRERLAQALKKPYASIGTITDISDSTLQIKTRSGEITQAGISKEDTTFIRISGKTRKTITFADIAIGDFVIAMGFKKPESTLEAVRVIASDLASENKRTAIFGTAADIDSKKDQFRLKKLKNGDELAVTDKNTKIRTFSESGLERASFDDIEEGQKVIVVGAEDSKGNFLATLIYLLPSP